MQAGVGAIAFLGTLVVGNYLNSQKISVPADILKASAEQLKQTDFWGGLWNGITGTVGKIFSSGMGGLIKGTPTLTHTWEMLGREFNIHLTGEMGVAIDGTRIAIGSPHGGAPYWHINLPLSENVPFILRHLPFSPVVAAFPRIYEGLFTDKDKMDIAVDYGEDIVSIEAGLAVGGKVGGTCLALTGGSGSILCAGAGMVAGITTMIIGRDKIEQAEAIAVNAVQAIARENVAESYRPWRATESYWENPHFTLPTDEYGNPISGMWGQTTGTISPEEFNYS